MSNKITVATTIHGTLDEVWNIWNSPKHITQWCSGHPDWYTPKAANELKIGGYLEIRMEAKDGSAGFDMKHTYIGITPKQLIHYRMEDGRECIIRFESIDGKVSISQEFDPENVNSLELQQEGWQNIMNNFKRYFEGLEQ